MIKISLVSIVYLCLLSETNADLWEKDVTDQMRIGLTETGYQKVDLRCGAESFLVNITLYDDFEGVVYTRGSFENKTSSCFKDHRQGVHLKGRNFLMNFEIPFHHCRTIMDIAESRYTNTLIVQHDPEFIMPGDAAFLLDCAFTPEYKMTTNIVAEPQYKSKISLVDADPSVDANVQDEKYIAESNSEEVSFSPLISKIKDEL